MYMLSKGNHDKEQRSEIIMWILIITLLSMLFYFLSVYWTSRPHVCISSLDWLLKAVVKILLVPFFASILFLHLVTIDVNY